eukprot:3571076-Rhodomonas_salina.1
MYPSALYPGYLGKLCTARLPALKTVTQCPDVTLCSKDHLNLWPFNYNSFLHAQQLLQIIVRLCFGAALALSRGPRASCWGVSSGVFSGRISDGIPTKSSPCTTSTSTSSSSTGLPPYWLLGIPTGHRDEVLAKSKFRWEILASVPACG